MIDRIADLIVADTSDLEQIIRAAAGLERLALAAAFNEPLAFAESIERRRSQIRRLSYSELRPADLEELARIDTLQASLAQDLEKYASSLRSIDQRETDLREAVRSTREAVRAWAASHTALAQAVRSNSPPDLSQLTDSIARLQALIVRLSRV